jgi:drug/metabolite transporter superfamily protein YnfA
MSVISTVTRYRENSPSLHGHRLGRNYRLLPALVVAEAAGQRVATLPAAVSLILFAWLLTLHEAAAGRVYAAYGGVYIGVAIIWLWGVDGIRPSPWDIAGVAVSLLGMAIIAFQPR